MRTDTGQTHRLEDYEPTAYLVPETHLHFDLAPECTVVTARLKIERRDDTVPGTPLHLDGDGLKLRSLLVDGRPVDESDLDVSPDHLALKQPPHPKRFELTIVTELNPAGNTELMGLYLSGGNYCTQCEAQGFRRITYFLDRPDLLSVYTVRIEAPVDDAPVLLSNGNPGSAGTLADGRHFAEWHDPFPKPSYLFALVAGDLGRITDEFTTVSGRKVALAIHVEKGKEERALYAMDALKRSMRWDEETFGCEYDLDVFNIVAVSDFNMGAMENKGLNIFNDKFVLADPDTATDTDYANIEAIIAHEYFHNWTGNRITCRDWFQLCLKEGLTVYRDHEFSADQRSRPVKRIAEVRTLKGHQFPEDAGPLAHPVRPRRYREINNFYTATVYEKGSEVVRMIRTILGPEDFRRGMDLYLKRHDGDAATVEDFVAAFEEASGRDLKQFSLWYHQAGTPNVSVSAAHDARARTFTVTIEQSLAPTPGENRKRLMHIPLAFGLVGPNGGDMAFDDVEGAAVNDGVIHLTKRRQKVVFSGVATRPVLSINRGFSAPVTLSLEQSDADRRFLARHDGDGVARSLVLSALLTEALIGAARNIRGGKQPDFDAGLIALIGELAGDEQLEPAYRALLLTLPSESDTAREMGRGIDPDAIYEAREALTGTIATAHRDLFSGLLKANAPAAAFSPDADSAGRRALANLLADYLSVADGSPALAAERLAAAGNMTDHMAALVTLVHRFAGSRKTGDALAAFEKRFGADPLVMDKWFQVQASAAGPQAVDTVRALMAHPRFQMNNPNRVRALIGTFAGANQTGFHRPDGEGYVLFADAVLKIDRTNPQVAARLATALRSWRSLEPGRREKARRTLARIAASESLSTDLSDIIDRTLA
ncbi:MAG: aminopeptidase N [Rhizobiaceae bacterium]